jgi:hypothetical protein
MSRPSRSIITARAIIMASAGRVLTAADLAEVTGCSLPAAQRALRSLAQAGLLWGTRARSTRAGSNPIMWRCVISDTLDR